MFALCRRRLSSRFDPFRVLGLERTATKAQVKERYRELARTYHPDANAGDSAKMEEVNAAYKLLLKDGAYERLHLPLSSTFAQQSHDAAATAARARAASPFVSPVSSDDGAHTQHAHDDAHNVAGDSTTPPPLTDEEVAELSALDPATERRTERGTYLYQSRDTLRWVELQRPLLQASQPRYATFGAAEYMTAELRRRQLELERARNERTRLQRVLDTLTDSGDLPTRNVFVLQLYGALLCVLVYYIVRRMFFMQSQMKARRRYYDAIEKERDELMALYERDGESVEKTLLAAAIVYLAASAHKTLDDPVQPAKPDVYYRTVRPPASNYHISAGTT